MQTQKFNGFVFLFEDDFSGEVKIGDPNFFPNGANRDSASIQVEVIVGLVSLYAKAILEKKLRSATADQIIDGSWRSLAVELADKNTFPVVTCMYDGSDELFYYSDFSKEVVIQQSGQEGKFAVPFTALKEFVAFRFVALLQQNPLLQQALISGNA